MPKLAGLATVLVAIAVAVIGVTTAGAADSAATYKATLTSGAEVPKPNAPVGAKGLFTASVTQSGSTRTISWKLTFSSLSGKAVAAHVHKGRAGTPGGVVLPLCGPCKTGQTGVAKISKDTADLLERGLAYVNVHTVKNASGEVRGQVKFVRRIAVTPPPQPDPAPTTPYEPPPGY